jgi:hypothetical protein
VCRIRRALIVSLHGFSEHVKPNKLDKDEDALV